MQPFHIRRPLPHWENGIAQILCPHLTRILDTALLGICWEFPVAFASFNDSSSRVVDIHLSLPFANCFPISTLPSPTRHSSVSRGKSNEKLQLDWPTSSCLLQPGGNRRKKHPLHVGIYLYPCVFAHLGPNPASASSLELNREKECTERASSKWPPAPIDPRFYLNPILVNSLMPIMELTNVQHGH